MTIKNVRNVRISCLIVLVKDHLLRSCHSWLDPAPSLGIVTSLRVKFGPRLDCDKLSKPILVPVLLDITMSFEFGLELRPLSWPGNRTSFKLVPVPGREVVTSLTLEIPSRTESSKNVWILFLCLLATNQTLVLTKIRKMTGIRNMAPSARIVNNRSWRPWTVQLLLGPVLRWALVISIKDNEKLNIHIRAINRLHFILHIRDL